MGTWLVVGVVLACGGVGFYLGRRLGQLGRDVPALKRELEKERANALRCAALVRARDAEIKKLGAQLREADRPGDAGARLRDRLRGGS